MSNREEPLARTVWEKLMLIVGAVGTVLCVVWESFMFIFVLAAAALCIVAVAATALYTAGAIFDVIVAGGL